jgi:hypothetical protein
MSIGLRAEEIGKQSNRTDAFRPHTDHTTIIKYTVITLLGESAKSFEIDLSQSSC